LAQVKRSLRSQFLGSSPVRRNFMSFSDLSSLGKMFLVEPGGTHLTDEELHSLEQLQPQAIMFRKRNFLTDVDYSTWLEAFRKLIAQLRQVLKHEHLIVSLDHEGGRVIRPPAPITRFPYAARWADSTSEVAEAMAIELKSLGVNVNFAPVADIHSNPDNPVINERAFGRTAAEVTRAAVQFAQVLQANGVAACAKHFPGHGDTRTDSHFGVPVLMLTLSELKQRELLPFQALIDAGVQMIMTSHILFPKIDPDNVATLSRTILHDLLRAQMGFKGVIIADAMGMQSVVGALHKRETIVKAVNAGLDIFLMAGDGVEIKDAMIMAKLLQEALQKREITEETLLASHGRVDRFASTLTQYSVTLMDAAVLQQHQTLATSIEKQSPWSGFDLILPGYE
jgi:beta-N-acetylhexosaminidase